MMKYLLLGLLILNANNAVCQRTIHIEITHTENFVVDDLEVRGDVIPLGDFDMGNWYTDGNTETDEKKSNAINNVITQRINDATSILGEKNNSAVHEVVASDILRQYRHPNNTTRTSDEKNSNLDNSPNSISNVSLENSLQYGNRSNITWRNDEKNNPEGLDDSQNSTSNFSFQNSTQYRQSSNITQQADEKNDSKAQVFSQNSFGDVSFEKSTQNRHPSNTTWLNDEKNNSKVSQNSFSSTSDLNKSKSEQIISQTDMPLNVTSYDRNYTSRKMLSPDSKRKPLLQVLKSLLRSNQRNTKNQITDKYVQNQKSKHSAKRHWNELFRRKRRINDETPSLQGKHDKNPVNLDSVEVVSKKAKNVDWKIKLLIAGPSFLILIIFAAITFCFLKKTGACLITLVKGCQFLLLCSPCVRRFRDKVPKHRFYQRKSKLAFPRDYVT